MTLPFSNPLSIPVLGFCAYSGTGKTTLLKQLIPELNHRGLRLAVIKHAHHNFDVDIPGKDSYEMRKAGARQMLVASHVRWALMTEDALEGDPQLPHLLAQIEADKVDIVLVEGFKKLQLPKIELHRAAHGKPFIHEHDDNILAVACCDDTVLPESMPRLDLNNINAIADYVMSYVSDWQAAHKAAQLVVTAEPALAQRPMTTVAPAHTSQTLSVSQGAQAILNCVTPLTEYLSLPLAELNGAVLATDAISPVDVPQQTNSAMDGFALAYDADIAKYQIVGQVLAGHSFERALNTGEAVRIMTGAPIPAGADTVVPKELTTEQDGHMSCHDGVIRGQHVRLAGEDIRQGATALTSGQRLGAAEIGLLASLGFAHATVVKKPVVAVFSTGDEVSQPGEALKPDCIYDANRYTISAMATALGCEVIDLGIIEDSEAALSAALSQAATQADVVISSGGVSVGNADYIKTVLAQLGQINFWRINMRPGRPLAFGQVNKALFFGLPGNPVAVMVSFLQFVQPALRKLAGEAQWQAKWLPAISDQMLPSRQGRSEFLRGVYHLGDDGRLHVRTTGPQGSGMLNSMVKANCLIVIDDADDAIAAGQIVYIQPFADLL
ncbi:bifunctional molybdopterin-guanine dinucleotide biosynthesis adaptor protein MobB/molybdopterin molybdotransferase MoeA [Shewanella sp. SNU WT4]|uniref:bifunctional molybdopterin-guanine dinucleotide biosynthesis adaptor protein MobB/molybdopterin molybdotransferase MoeA n=1 Tax=Shewanella sp. SNU WT4 TaxID=2590015 RepID=UPI001129CA3A|nr:bifunctional molybdopterin-guanine dinucleotide biosynthesis adaptor protein MobB/molybdopterin molybdotransferase MoeA [Shewanella sp. SNU WT4]QDF65640.1 bifunctional molybdopterin-guanine dinucleotide biosynthesis adaptor protein MobB/molybdopterin molybdotransferase MoeA [Shewanella sp. SNU WT4]